MRACICIYIYTCIYTYTYTYTYIYILHIHIYRDIYIYILRVYRGIFSKRNLTLNAKTMFFGSMGLRFRALGLSFSGQLRGQGK